MAALYAPATFSVDRFRALWEELPDTRLRFGHGETGWGKTLGDGFAIVANIPLEPRLRLMDVVELGPEEHGIHHCGKVVWRAYAQKTGLRYPSPKDDDAADALWTAINEALFFAGLAAESYMPGLAAVCHHADSDVLEILRAAKINTTGFALRTD